MFRRRWVKSSLSLSLSLLFTVIALLRGGAQYIYV
ncbi:unnamed protein product [Tuber melanosporum]|uniref:(Perigord truffle) hypothetical protein n=1 Tax=Tuber melanosporum (strain Mel28) TaxID=656061 RepID=D5G693_TUBMM|nr:uncharacterized protein GSTUM_00001662001 [Tuber melanosporum]CAZ80036.1 unnamed protein product [Tuber melanosporum]